MTTSTPTPSFTSTYKSISSTPILADIYLPAPTHSTYTTHRPLLLWFHGGGFFVGSRAMVSLPQVSSALSRGWLVLSADYRLAPGTNVRDGALADTRDLLAWCHSPTGLDAELAKHGSELRVARDRVIATGTSAGGALALASMWTAPVKPVAVVDYCGIKDLADAFFSTPIPGLADKMPPPSDDARRLLEAETVCTQGGVDAAGGMGGPPASDTGAVRRAFAGACSAHGRLTGTIQPDGDWAAVDAMWNVSKDWPPIWILHGDQDNIVPHRMSARLVEKCQQAGVRAQLLTCEGYMHFFTGFKKPGDKAFEASERAFDEIEALLV